mmetsp:Transcript_34176/g.72744  ORF Transcript_34176/g.72744 Transcript_34176/m.72744 type:complete len:233 (-) Transcript_34176:695-1393(-)
MVVYRHGLLRGWRLVRQDQEDEAGWKNLPRTAGGEVVYAGDFSVEVHPRPAHHASRLEVRELLFVEERQSQDGRLRYREGAGMHSCLCADSDRHPLLPEPRDLSGKSLLLRLGHLVHGLHPLRALRAARALRRARPEEPHPEDHQRADARAALGVLAGTSCLVQGDPRSRSCQPTQGCYDIEKTCHTRNGQENAGRGERRRRALGRTRPPVQRREALQRAQFCCRRREETLL